VVGGLIATAGLILALGPFSVGGGRELDWWISPWLRPSLSAPAWGLAAAGSVLLIGLIWATSAFDRPDVADSGWLDASLHLRTGLSSMLLGIVLAIGGWIAATGELKVGRLVLTPGQTAESYRATYRDGSMKVMLPRRITLTDLSLGEPLEATVRFKRAGADRGQTARLAPGRAILTDDLRWTLVGADFSKGTKRAVIGSDRPKTIAAAASPGESFQLSPQGRSYEMVDILDNYLKTLGPAARVRSDELGEFLVFQRMPPDEHAPDFEHDLTLERLERIPALVVRVSTPTPIWPSGIGGGLMVAGLALLLTTPGREPSDEEAV
jgi:hypothetical protein